VAGLVFAGVGAFLKDLTEVVRFSTGPFIGEAIGI
jgi:hypothetical protein